MTERSESTTVTIPACLRGMIGVACLAIAEDYRTRGRRGTALAVIGVGVAVTTQCHRWLRVSYVTAPITDRIDMLAHASNERYESLMSVLDEREEDLTRIARPVDPISGGGGALEESPAPLRETERQRSNEGRA